MRLRGPRPGRPISLDDETSGGFALGVESGLGVDDDDSGPIGGGVEGRTGWSPACVDGAAPVAEGLLVSPSDPFEFGEAVEAVEEVAAAGLSPPADVELPASSTYGRRIALLPATLCSLRKASGLRLLAGSTGRGEAGGGERSPPSLSSSDVSLAILFLLFSSAEKAR